jgi:uncharacterized repeat protein (TIGR03803 family)
MKHRDIVIVAIVSSALLAACGYHALAPTSSVDQPPVVPGEKVLYRFQGDKDGSNPAAAPLDVNGTLYGTTAFGGGNGCLTGYGSGCGTIFKIDTSGAGYAVLHRFAKGGLEGFRPLAGLIDSGGMLYGTTEFGGDVERDFPPCFFYGPGCGTVFAINPSGNGFSILHSFKGTGGRGIDAGVISVAGTLYGTAREGGKAGVGVLFTIASDGYERPLYSFGRCLKCGAHPVTAPIDVHDVLFGSTPAGGGANARCFDSDIDSCGAVYRVSVSGKGYATLYGFKNGTDGAVPNGVIDVNGTLYGTTTEGGKGRRGCCGTIFRIGTLGRDYRVLYRFKGGTDGESPTNGLVTDGKGVLYSTADGGGCCGMIFKINMSGKGFAVLYRFKGGMDGAGPNGLTIDANGVLYGTTSSGGGSSACGSVGCGTVFSFTP